MKPITIHTTLMPSSKESSTLDCRKSPFGSDGLHHLALNRFKRQLFLKPN